MRSKSLPITWRIPWILSLIIVTGCNRPASDSQNLSSENELKEAPNAVAVQDSLGNSILREVKFGMTKDEILQTNLFSNSEVNGDEIVLDWEKRKMLSASYGLPVIPSYKIILERNSNFEIASKGIISFYSDYDDWGKFKKTINLFIKQYSEIYGKPIHILEGVEELNILDFDGTSKWEKKDLAVWSVDVPQNPGVYKYINIRGYKYEAPMSYVCEIEICCP